MPKALTDMTDTEPTVEHIEMYTKGLDFPYFGPNLYIMRVANIATAAQYRRKPKALNSESVPLCEHQGRTWLYCILQQIFHSFDLFVGRCMQDYDDRAYQTHGAP